MPLLPRGRRAGHRILVVEDDPGCRDTAMSWLVASGHEPRGASCVEEAFRAMQEEDFCLYVIDQELPHAPGNAALIAGGRTIVEAIRKADPRRVELAHLTPIVVWSGYSQDPEFVWAMRDLGADSFVAKGEDGGAARFQSEVAKRLHLAGRDDHAACAAFAGELAGVAARPMSKKYKDELAPPVELYVDGRKNGPRTLLEINGEERGIQDGRFVLLLRLIDKWERSGHPWADREELGIDDSREAISRVRAVFRGLAPPGFDPIQADRSGRFRLHPEVLVRFVPWEQLAEHPHPGVRKLAAAHNAWRAEENRREGYGGGVQSAGG